MSLFKSKKYQIVEDNIYNGALIVKILRGKFKGLVYEYGRVAFHEPHSKTGESQMKFEITVIENPKTLHTGSTDELDALTGEILVEILEQKISEGKLKTNALENGITDIEELGDE
jgi:hypothetical protein